MLKKIYIIFISIIALLSFLPVFAEETYKLTVPFPGETEVADPADYLFALYRFSLIAGGALALVVIAYHAIRYITSAENPSKQSDAKDGIVKAIIGLSLLLGAVLLLNTIGVTIQEQLSLKELAVKKAEPEKITLTAAEKKSEAIKTTEQAIEAAKIEEEISGRDWGNDSSNIEKRITYTEKQIIHTEQRIIMKELELDNLYDQNLNLKQNPYSEKQQLAIAINAQLIKSKQSALESEKLQLESQKNTLEELKKK